MTVHTQIREYLASLPERKRSEMEALHALMLRLMPNARLSFLDGRNEEGRTVSNPAIGYGQLTLSYADGSTRPFYQVGLSANTSGISVYLMGVDDRTYLPATYGDRIGKANVTGYCIKFSALRNIDLAVLEAAVLDAVARTSA